MVIVEFNTSANRNHIMNLLIRYFVSEESTYRELNHRQTFSIFNTEIIKQSSFDNFSPPYLCDFIKLQKVEKILVTNEYCDKYSSLNIII